jgi:hypothetical protein
MVLLVRSLVVKKFRAVQFSRSNIALEVVKHYAIGYTVAHDIYLIAKL